MTNNETPTPLEAVNEIRKNNNGQLVLVLQDGGALGAYQGGVYQDLHEAGVEPDWIIGTEAGLRSQASALAFVIRGVGKRITVDRGVFVRRNSARRHDRFGKKPACCTSQGHVLDPTTGRTRALRMASAS